MLSPASTLESANRRIPLPMPDTQRNMFIVEPLTGSGFAKIFMTHPSTEERIQQLLAI